MTGGDYYAELGLSRGATGAEIKKAFRKLAKELHPDRNPGDKKAEERFKKVSQAYEVLSDRERRSLYDEFGEVGLREGFDADAARARRSWQQQGGGFRVGDLFGGGGAVDFQEIFRGGRSAPRRGRDLSASVTVDLLDAVRGCERELSFIVGSNTKQLTVRIPPGVTDGAKMRLRGQGAPGGRGGTPGDLILTVQVKSHPRLWLDGEELHMRVAVTPKEAHQGAKIELPTPGGSVTVRVPEGSQTGSRLRLRGKGGPRKGGSSGDLVIHLEVMLPARGSARIKAALDTLEEAFEDGEIRNDLPTF